MKVGNKLGATLDLEMPDKFSIDDIKVAYIAGFFDGEGTISVLKGGGSGYPHLHIKVDNTDTAPLQFITDIFGGHIYGYDRHDGVRKKNYMCRFSGKEATYVLARLLPYLICKKKRAQLGIECTYTSLERRFEILDEMRELNKRGVDK